MKIGDLIQIKSIKKKILGLVIEEPCEKTDHWAIILDSSGNFVWWPPSEVINLTSEMEVKSQGAEIDKH